MKISFVDKLKRQISKGELNFKSLFALFIFGIIILVFVFFNGYGGKYSDKGMGAGQVAVVGGKYLSAADLDQEVQKLERAYAGFLGGNLGAMQRNFLRSQALENLVSQEVLTQGAFSQRVFASDIEIQRTIMQELPYFQEEGRFRRERYEQLLAANAMTPSRFEDQLRHDMVIRHMRDLFAFSAAPSIIELSKAEQLEKTMINFEYLHLEKSEWIQKISLSDSDVRNELSNPDFLKRAETKFKTSQADYEQKEEVKASHILIKFDKAIPESEVAALKKIKEIAARAKKEDFGKLASETSEDLGSKSKAGDLGYFGKGKMVPEFEAVAFAMKPGELSEPVKSSFGYHLIKLNDRHEAKKAEFEQVKEKVARALIGEDKFDEVVKSLEKSLNNKAEGIEALVLKYNLKWQETGKVALGVETLPKIQSASATEAAFSIPLNETYSGLVRDTGEKYVFRIKDRPQFNKSEDSKKPLDLEKWNSAKREIGGERIGMWIESVKKALKVEKSVLTSAKPGAFSDDGE